MAEIGKIGKLFSESSEVSSMRFCVIAIVVTILLNFTMGNIALMLGWIQENSITGTEVAAMIGALATKWGQKTKEKE